MSRCVIFFKSSKMANITMTVNSNLTKSQFLAGKIEAMIRAGAYPPDSRLESIRKLASKYNVSIAVARNCHKILEKENLITTRHGEGAFVILPPAQKTKTFGVFTSYSKESIEGYFESMVLTATELNIMILPVSVDTSDKNWRKKFLMLVQSKPHVILIDIEARHFPLKFLYADAGSIPLCFVNRWEWNSDYPEMGVLVDYSSTLSQALGYLKEKKHKRILILGPHRPPQPYLRKRYEAAVRSMGFKFPSREFEYLPMLDGDKALSAESPELKRIFGDAENMPTAIVAHTDFMAAMLMRMLKEIDVNYDHIEIIGCFDTAWSKQTDHEFSSFNIDYKKLWRKAFNLFQENTRTENRIEWITPRMIQRHLKEGVNG